MTDESRKPLLIFDGRCGFCRIWIEYWKQITGDNLDYEASQEAGPQNPQINREDFSRSVQLVLPSGEVLSGARAVYRTLAYDPSRRWYLQAWEHVPGSAAMSEAAYRLIASHRNFFYHATVILFGRTVNPLRYAAVESLFRRLLSLIWLIAFVSFGVQASGLIGSHGVLPVSLYLNRVSQVLGPSAWHTVPTLLWLGTS